MAILNSCVSLPEGNFNFKYDHYLICWDGTCENAETYLKHLEIWH